MAPHADESKQGTRSPGFTKKLPRILTDVAFAIAIMVATIILLGIVVIGYLKFKDTAAFSTIVQIAFITVIAVLSLLALLEAINIAVQIAVTIGNNGVRVSKNAKEINENVTAILRNRINTRKLRKAAKNEEKLDKLKLKEIERLQRGTGYILPPSRTVEGSIAAPKDDRNGQPSRSE